MIFQIHSKAAGGLKTDSLVPFLLVVSQPVRMCIAGNTLHNSCFLSDIRCKGIYRVESPTLASIYNSWRPFVFRSVLK